MATTYLTLAKRNINPLTLTPLTPWETEVAHLVKKFPSFSARKL
jgi:hypothetical protein